MVGTVAAPNVRYTTGNLQTQALEWLQRRVAAVAPPARDLEQLPAWLAKSVREVLEAPPRAVSLMRDVSFVVATDERGRRSTFTIVRDNGHSHIAEPFDEQERRLPSEDRLVVVAGLLGAYPNALFAIDKTNSAEFAAAVRKLDTDASYRALRERFGVSRSSPQFWRFSDQLQSDHVRHNRLEHGLLDYTRLDPN